MDIPLVTWIAIFGAIVAAISLYFGYRRYQFSKQTEAAKGTFEGPDLRLSILGTEDIRDVILVLQIPADGVVCFPLPILIKNIGKKTATDVQLMFRSVRQLFFGGRSVIHSESLAAPRNLGIAVEVFDSGPNWCNALTTIPRINPGTSFDFTIPISIGASTIIEDTLTVPVSGGRSLKIAYRLLVSIPFDCMIAQKDAEPKGDRLRIQIVNGDVFSARDLLREYNAERRKKQRSRPLGDKIVDFGLHFLGFRRDEVRSANLLFVKGDVKPMRLGPGSGGDVKFSFDLKQLRVINGWLLTEEYIFPALEKLTPESIK